MSKIAERLKKARAWKGWSQAQLAVAAEVSTGTIGNIESGARKSKGSIPQIAKALGINYEWLANGEGPMLPIVANLSANITSFGGISATGTLTDASKQPIAHVEPENTAIETIASGPLHSKALAALFETLPQDQRLRAKVFSDVCTLILGATRQQVPEPESEPFHAPSPRKQSV